MRGFLIMYLKGMRIMMFQLSGYHCRAFCQEVFGFRGLEIQSV